MNENDLVSIIIPTYKRPDLLPRAINSVLAQTYEHIEIIVVDDNDPETSYRKSTEKVMEEYKDNPRLVYIKHERNKNGAAARNTGIQYCNGKYLSFLDDDDWYRPEKIEKQVEYLNNNPEYDAVCCGWNNRDDERFIPKREGDLTFELLSGMCIIYTNTIMIKKAVALKVKGFDERFRRNQEAAFLLRYFKYGYKIGVINENLVEFDISDRSNMSNPRKNEEDFDFFLKAHEENIANCELFQKNARSIIYSYRYRGALLSYLKYRDYCGAIKLYIKMIKIMPLRFNKDLIIYFFIKVRMILKSKNRMRS